MFFVRNDASFICARDSLAYVRIMCVILGRMQKTMTQSAPSSRTRSQWRTDQNHTRTQELMRCGSYMIYDDYHDHVRIWNTFQKNNTTINTKWRWRAFNTSDILEDFDNLRLREWMHDDERGQKFHLWSVIKLRRSKITCSRRFFASSQDQFVPLQIEDPTEEYDK